jgi:hypothetical protein
MHRITALVLLLAAAACGALPPPPNQTYGVFSYDVSTRTLWMRGDEPYYVPESVNTIGLRCASTITVTWEQQGDRRVVERYSVEEWSEIFC